MPPPGWRWGLGRYSPLIQGIPLPRRRYWYRDRSPPLGPPQQGRRPRRCGLWPAARSSRAGAATLFLLGTCPPRSSPSIGQPSEETPLLGSKVVGTLILRAAGRGLVPALALHDPVNQRPLGFGSGVTF